MKRLSMGKALCFTLKFFVETPEFFIDEYVDLGSDERIQDYHEYYCGAYCLYTSYVLDKGFRIKSALIILIHRCKYPGRYNECFYLSCSIKDKDNDVNDQGTCFADNDSDSVNEI